MKSRMHFAVCAATLMACISSNASIVLFQDDFEASLSQWSGLYGGIHSGVIVTDPLVSSNHVLTFTSLGSGGDIFSKSSISVTSYARVIIEFRYLGFAKVQSAPDDFGGFFGVSYGGTAWIAGTYTPATTSFNGFQGVKLVDDGSWHSYQIDITPIINNYGVSAMCLTAEDWVGAGGIAGDAYFDDVKVIAVSVPQLSITITNPVTVRLSWQESSDSFVVQQNPDLTTTNWVTLTNTPILFGGEYQVDLPSSDGSMFYRLKF